MRLVVGLGNPGRAYDATRHNVGFEVVDALANEEGISLSDRKFKGRFGRGRVAGEDCFLLKPDTYMNVSGESVGPMAGFYRIPPEDVIVVHDDLDIEVGRLKMKRGGGHGGHNGLRSLMSHLPSPDFVRIRVGVGRPPPGRDPVDYVLGRFRSDDRSLVDAAIEEAVRAIQATLRDGLSRAMNVYNRLPQSRKAEGQEEKAGPAQPKTKG